MIDALLSWTALPNLHPALVHFPIALAAVALLFDGLQLAAPQRAGFDRSAALLWVLAAVGAAATYWAGQQAADGLGVLPGEAEVALAAHADSAWATLIAVWVLATLRAALWWRDRNASMRRRDLARAAALVGALALQGLLLHTADLGGALVYRHGVAVAARAELRREARDESPAPVRAGAETGISIPVRGHARVELSGSFQDALLEARLDTSEFDGSVTLGVAAEAKNADLLRADSSGRVALVARRDGAEQILDEGSMQRPQGEWTLSLSTADRHIKGFVDGKNVVHGHVSPLETMGAELLFEGSGTVRIAGFAMTPTLTHGAGAHSHEDHPTGGHEGGHEHEEHAH